MKLFSTFFLFLILFFNSFSQTWVPQNSGVTSSLRHIHFLTMTEGWAVGSDGVFLRTTDGGATWNKKTIAGGSLLIGTWMYKETIGWVAGDDGVYFTDDKGVNWTHMTGPWNVTKLWMFDASNIVAVGGETSSHKALMWKTINYGTEWTPILNTTDYSRIYGIQFYDRNTGWAFDDDHHFLKTTDGGVTWNAKTLGITMDIESMRFSSSTNGIISGKTTNAGYVLRTTDGGETWSGQSNKLTYLLSDIYFTSSINGWAVGGSPMGSGIYRTTDGGATWNLAQSTGTIGWQSIYMKDDSHGWIASYTGEIYTLGGPTAVEDNEIINASSYTLDQNYPNPFNPSTEISFRLPYSSNLKVDVYNSAGELVSNLFSGVKEQGSHQLQFNAAGLASGVYLYRVSAVSLDGKNNFQASKKMILIK